MNATEQATRGLYDQLVPGDHVVVEHEIKVGQKVWTTWSAGVVVRKERRRHGLHYRRNGDDRVWSDVLVLRRYDGELSTLSIDEFTKMRRGDK